MNKRVAMFIAFYLVKIVMLAVLLFLVLRLSGYVYESFSGSHVSEDTYDIVMVGMAVIAGVLHNTWLFGHKEEVDKYYDEKDRG